MKLFYIGLLVVIYIAFEFDLLFDSTAADKRYEEYISDYEAMLEHENSEDLAAWLEEHPDSFHTDIGESQLEQLRWIEAYAENSVAAYDRYLELYPDGRTAKIAKRQKALVMHDLTEYSVYLALNPDDNQIRWLRDILLIERAQQENTKYAFEKFILENPDSAFVAQAEFYRDNLYP